MCELFAFSGKHPALLHCSLGEFARHSGSTHNAEGWGLRRIVAAFAQELRALGPANFIYADGDALFAHGHRRTQDGGAIRPPGLHLLCRSCSPDNSERSGFEAQGLRIEPTQAGGAQMLVASVPLSQRRAAPELTHPLGGRTPPGVPGALDTDASWRALGEGELVLVRAGRFEPLPQVAFRSPTNS